MKRCPFCTADLPDEAVKCKHCGEWLDGRSAPDDRGREQTVNVRWQASEAHIKVAKGMLIWFAVSSAIGLAAFLVVVFVFVVPEWKRIRQDHNEFQKEPGWRQKELPGR
jgi:uncharacterized membrane protein YvbJ